MDVTGGSDGVLDDVGGVDVELLPVGVVPGVDEDDELPVPELLPPDELVVPD